MARSKPKKTGSARPAKKAMANAPLDPLRAGMPALDSITNVEEFRKGKKVFRIIHTNEVDEYDQAPSTSQRKKR